MKIFFKWVVYSFAIALTLGTMFFVNLFFMKPFSLDHYLAKELILQMIDSPESLTYIGIVDGFNWVTGHQSKISITGIKEIEEDLIGAKESLSLLLSYKDTNLTEQQKISKEIAVFDQHNFIEEAEKILLNQKRNARAAFYKTKQIAHYFDWVHTVDRIKIARRLDEMRPDNMAPLNICIQVNTSGEATKSGLSINEVEDFINELKQFKRLKVRGLMSLPELKASYDEQRNSFSLLKKVLHELGAVNPELDTLSIGTTQDMEAAIAEGATCVRIGTAVFGPRDR